MTQQAENLKAIDEYFKRTVAITPKAANIQTDWLTWYPKLGWAALNIDSKVYDEARARRNLFNLSNVTSPAEKAKVESVLANGITSEDLSGKSKPEVAAAKARIADIQKKLETQGSTHPTIKQGSKGDAVKEWQGIIGAKADGNFGPGTHTATVTWQKGRGLTADGVVGPKTWAAALGVKTPITARTDEAVASLPAVFNPPPRPPARPPVTAPKPTPAAISAAAAAGPKPATVVATAGGPVTGVKPVGESHMPEMVTASMIPIPKVIRDIPTWAKWALGLFGLAGVGVTVKKALDERG